MLEGQHREPVEGPVQSGRVCSATLAATLGMGSGARAAHGDQQGGDCRRVQVVSTLFALGDALGRGRLPSQS